MLGCDMESGQCHNIAKENIVNSLLFMQHREILHQASGLPSFSTSFFLYFGFLVGALSLGT